MQKAQTWRELLGTILSDSREKQRLSDELGVTPITLTRWISGESDPRPQNLRHLLDVLPQYREQLLDLLRDETNLRELIEPLQDNTDKAIPSEFYARVFTARASTTENLRFWSTCNLILQQAIEQLDPERLGMCIWVVRCMPPSGPFNKVRSLRESVGLGTPPWGGNLEQQAMFLGAESLAGNVVTLCRSGIIQNLDEEHNLIPASRVEYEKSVAIYPILYAGKIAGVLLVSSTQYNHFLSQRRTSLIQNYADLIALAFEPEDFYAPEQIALSIMPSHTEQKSYFAHFRQRVTDTMITAASRHQPTNYLAADQEVWQQLEAELLQIPVHEQQQ
ncbi:hypothetical protein EPA93_18630 [Ktedonosporobacter rubrisoli]|uniref:GAF domain-containing protein n=1 Tax=Ktedonosporobacter rubrisoli TaxID=2509675 RepID=A0A4P6JRR5_KTERU|nr:hypothetical protein [Ktedonosporobacter rubrisoli]QBD77900.1 hypothetical protein EPA93_18630 [Ktedonosporobacter rubrisoli]